MSQLDGAVPPSLDDDFLLRSATARRLYHEFAAPLPIIDFHNHLDPGDLAADRSFENLTRLWIATDPYKHRAMRMVGVPERVITGGGDDRETFNAWAATVEQTVGNPLFAWTALELQRYFGIEERLTSESADRIWETCNALLRTPEYTARGLVARLNVACLCTSDPPADALTSHAELTASAFPVRVLPSVRVDDLDDPSWETSFDLFNSLGCRLADHALVDYDAPGLRRLGAECSRRGWILQVHLGAQRRTSTRLRRLAGPAGGYATIGPDCDIPGLCRLLDDLESQEALPRTILYPLNPADYPALATLTGSFAEDGVRGKLQLGPAWWYNDHALGIRHHLDALANYGLLSTFIGMTTDSRSLLSLVRHEYFRRVLCNWLGEQVQAGLMPADEQLLGALVRAVAYENARDVMLPRD